MTSRAAWIAIGMGTALLGAVAAIDVTAWPTLVVRSRTEIALVLGAGIYGAVLVAVAVHRIARPDLPVPVLAYPVFLAFLFASMSRSDESSANDDRDGFGPSGDHIGRGWAIFLLVIGAVMFTGGAIAPRWLERSASASPIVSQPPFEAAPPKHASPAPDAEILAAPDLAAAIAYATARMTDEPVPSPGAIELARYLAARTTAADLAIAKNETSVALATRDPGGARGKRLCVGGTLGRLEDKQLGDVAVQVTRLAVRGGGALEVIAVAAPEGATGKRVRFCGVVAGRAGSAGKPVALAVGWLDLPRG